MKYLRLFFSFAIACLLFSACTDNITDAGKNLQSSDDLILLHADTFHLQTNNLFADSICAHQDSFLLGIYQDAKFGTTKGEILAQFACSEGFVFPENSEADSIEIVLYYSTWFGDGYTPMEIKVYEMNQGTFDYSGRYYSNLKVEDYCDKTNLWGRRIVAPAVATDSVYSSSASAYYPYISFMLGDDGRTVDETARKTIAEQFLNAVKDAHASQETFTEAFNGLYITTEFGTAAMLHITQIDMMLYYHFTYSLNGRDTTVNATRGYYANAEVRQINRFEHSGREDYLQEDDTVNYIVSPANIYTKIALPMRSLRDTITANMGDRRVYLNAATIKVEVADYQEYDEEDASTWLQSSTYMMLIKESAFSTFFADGGLLSDTCAIATSLTTTENSDGDEILYYSYDISSIITAEIRKDETQMADTLNLLLVPVTSAGTATTSSGTTVVTTVIYNYLLNGTAVRSGSNPTSPMRLTLLYSGF